MKLEYNFRIGPETLWLIGGTVVGTMLVDLSGRLLSIEGWPALDTWQAWALAITFNGFRTGIGAIIAFATGGFQTPGETKEQDAAEGGGAITGPQG